MKHIEDSHQEALFSWATMNARSMPDLAKLFAIPNGGKRNKLEAIRLKKQGVKAGVPDICLPVARGVYHALYIELKRPIVKGEDKPKTSKEQLARIKQLNDDGYMAGVCYGWIEAKLAIIEYLNNGLAR